MTAEPGAPEIPKSLAEALLELQASLPTVNKRQIAKVETSKGSYSYRFAGLNAVMSAVLPRLNKLSLVFLARPVLVDGRALLSCELLHVPSGERLVAEYPLAVAPNAPAQAIGSAISYGRRYCLSSMIGLVCDEDDDGRAASQRYDEDQQVSRRREPFRSQDRNGDDESPTNTDHGRYSAADLERRKKRLFALYNEVGPKERTERLADLAQILERPVASSNDLSAEDVEAVITVLSKRKREQRKESADA